MGLALEQLKAQVASIPTTDHFTLITPEADPQALDATGGALPTHLFAIPAGTKSFCVGSLNAARTGVLAGYCAASNSPRTKSGPIESTLSGACFIPAKLDDGSAPTHIYVCNTDASAGWVWIQFYK